MRRRPRAVRKYVIRAVVFQEGEWLCAQCLEYNLVAQAKSLKQLSRALQRLIVAHVAVRLEADDLDPVGAFPRGILLEQLQRATRLVDRVDRNRRRLLAGGDEESSLSWRGPL